VLFPQNGKHKTEAHVQELKLELLVQNKQRRTEQMQNSSAIGSAHRNVQHSLLHTQDTMDDDDDQNDKDDIPLTHTIDVGEVAYEAENVMVSVLKDHKLGLALVWSSWSTRTISLYSNGYFKYSDKRHRKVMTQRHFFQLRGGLEVKLMGNIGGGGEEDEDEYVNGVVVKCKTYDGIETYFRCILSQTQLQQFLQVLQEITGDESLSKLRLESLQQDVKRKAQQKPTTLIKQSLRNMGIGKSRYSSVMRKATAKAMDKYDRRTTEQRILNKRRAFKSLPALGSNDLIHGSV
jgi:hypothetical protein